MEDLMQSQDWTNIWNKSSNRSRNWYDKVMWRYFKKLLKNIEIPEGNTLLDIGCGEGGVSLHLAKEYNLDVTLVDFSKIALERAVKKYESLGLNVESYHGDVRKMKKKKFDIVMSEGLIEHFVGEKRYDMFKVHHDLTKKNGLNIIFVPMKSSVYNLWIRGVKKFSPEIEEIPFSKEEILGFSKKLNQEVLNTITIGKIWFGMVARL